MLEAKKYQALKGYYETALQRTAQHTNQCDKMCVFSVAMALALLQSYLKDDVLQNPKILNDIWNKYISESKGAFNENVLKRCFNDLQADLNPLDYLSELKRQLC